jgi:acetyltransferase
MPIPIPMPASEASPRPVAALAGKLAFVSQSGALASAVLDWASARGIGFSKLVAVGAGDDVDIADLLDFLARDPNTEAILLHVEQIGHARKFLSAARAAARGKPVVILKSGNLQHTAGSAASHAGALTGMDDAADAAIRRAGMLRVYSIKDLFGAARILSQARHVGSARLHIVSNGAGPGLLAADALLACGGALAILAPAVAAAMASTPARPGNPVDLGFNATPADFVAAFGALVARHGADAGTANAVGDDAILVIHAPSVSAPASEVAARIAPLLAHGPDLLARRRCSSWGTPLQHRCRHSRLRYAGRRGHGLPADGGIPAQPGIADAGAAIDSLRCAASI